MNEWYATLGTTPELSLLELQSVSKRYNQLDVSLEYFPALLHIKTESEDAQTFLNESAGFVKLGKLIAVAPTLEILTKQIASTLHPQVKSAFAFSASPSSLNAKAIAASVKKHIGSPSFRFRVLKDIRESSGILTNYQEVSVFNIDQQYIALSTIAVQSLEKWSSKDYDRPKSDPRSGMLPPKIARMMVNAAIPFVPHTKAVLYDPFCGTGTVLGEALDLGLSVIGSDISPKAVSDATLNCDWFVSTFQKKGTYRLFQADASNLSMEVVGNPVDAIVFEGYLGPPNLRPEKIFNYYKGLKKMYIGVLKQLYRLLKNQGRLVCALPEYHYQGHVKNVSDLIDQCEKYGYTQVGKAVTYGRPQAMVKRSISVLQKMA